MGWFAFGIFPILALVLWLLVLAGTPWYVTLLVICALIVGYWWLAEPNDDS